MFASRFSHRLACPHVPSVSNQIVQHPRRRSIITATVGPSPDVFIERPEVMVLAESSLYTHSWKDSAANFYPMCGMHFASVDIMRPQHPSHSPGTRANTVTSLESLEQTMAKDLSHLGETAAMEEADLYKSGHAPPITSTSAYSVLIARGPIQCLVSQYFLESLPLAGLVLVDPLLLPDDGRAGKGMMKVEEGESRWTTSLLDLIAMWDKELPASDPGQSVTDPPLLVPSTKSAHPTEKPGHELELPFLRSLASGEIGKSSRPLKLEPGSIPLLVLYSGDHAYHDYYRICAERTAAFHTCGGKGDYFDQVPIIKIQKKVGKEGPMDDLDKVMMSIYEWYDEVVA